MSVCGVDRRRKFLFPLGNRFWDNGVVISVIRKGIHDCSLKGWTSSMSIPTFSVPTSRSFHMRGRWTYTDDGDVRWDGRDHRPDITPVTTGLGDRTRTPNEVRTNGVGHGISWCSPGLLSKRVGSRRGGHGLVLQNPRPLVGQVDSVIHGLGRRVSGLQPGWVT